jgi:hypothetical protein
MLHLATKNMRPRLCMYLRPFAAETFCFGTFGKCTYCIVTKMTYQFSLRFVRASGTGRVSNLCCSCATYQLSVRFTRITERIKYRSLYKMPDVCQVCSNQPHREDQLFSAPHHLGQLPHEPQVSTHVYRGREVALVLRIFSE